MKKGYLFLLVAVMAMVLSGCAQVAVGALELAAETLVTSAASNATSKKSVPKSNVLIGVYQIGKYEIKSSDSSTCIHFKAYDKKVYVTGIYFEKNKSEDMQMINNFNQINEAEKKEEIRRWFLKYTAAKIDLGPIETEITETAETPPSPTPSFSVPSFAPTN